ncbi:P-loop NTPase [Methylocystis rosea]|uniref:nucleotide-binding protein n=1 Tax=Methylocystis rosea TaxID=173366 RepID=UPI001FD8AE2A|nr:P-loop NTPase [Methylocystis rosea]
MATAAALKSRPRAAALPAAVKRVALVANEKGGVGKSVFTRTLVDHLRTTGKRVAAYDADGSVGATARVLGSRDASGSVERVQTRSKASATITVARMTNATSCSIPSSRAKNSTSMTSRAGFWPISRESSTAAKASTASSTPSRPIATD